MPTNRGQAANYTVLIVDDEAIARDILEGHLATDGYQVVLVNSGFQALNRFEQNPPDLVLLDIMMPHLDGFEVCQRIKTNERWQHIPVILITGFWDNEQVIRADEAGADGFLKKPVDGAELRAQVRSLLGLH
ncbi:MAG: response regulator [Anaerolineae bacterium]|nr:response regulator [Anaerolineae bacterium]